MPHTARWSAAGPALAAAVVLSACGGGAGGASSGGGPTGGDVPPAAGISRPENDLRIDVDRGDGSPPESWTLLCAGVVEGTHPQAQAACDHLAGMADPFAALPGDVMCTEQFGGNQTASVTGRWHGEAVDLELSRSDGCRISQWNSLGPVLPIPVGVDDPPS
ncbi:hypothetical protein DQ237_18435 [Blastococcus sp. TF02-8]|uniref:SSI family serine proteinase inhibitor n=1 Tax=Blastococcus sp. TF02-8 TaxID=2250574 RepID=UPI000E015EA3|nr:SSI family serine proteinase inhibitor [Blastococcus sp. TF02-8]RBY93421.1 hypothetical protein DQ237_18435 [Blastococcus sp. TF02-8]